MMTTTSKKMAMLLLIASAAYDGIFYTGRARNWAVSADPITLPGGFVLATPPTGDVALFNVKQSKSPKGLRTNSPTMTRKPVTSPNSQQQPPSPSSASQPSSPVSSPTSSDTCSNLTCTPGMTAFEYLGMGYDMIKGNPRGSLSSELDPGFRSRVIKLDYDKGYLTTDHKYKVPFGTELRRSTSCKFSSSSVEVSSSSDYQRELSHEAETSESLNVNGKAEFEGWGVEASASFSYDRQFSGSQKYGEFSQARTNEQTTTFEAKALCTEFTANIQPDAPIEFDEDFLSALNKLPVPFADTTESKQAYKHFLSTYGTHYIHHLVLGAKHIYSTVMKASDAMELSKKNIDVKSALSVQKQGEISGSYGGFSAEIGGKTENNSTNSDSLKNEQMKEIKGKIARVDEVNVGGVPPADGNWKTWAASVIERPMPIVYKLTGIWEMMKDATKEQAFFDAMESLYGIKLNPAQLNTTYLEAFHFGVSGPEGELISDYSYSSNFEYRALLKYNGFDAMNTTYDITWEEQSQSAIFATPINKMISPSKEDFGGSPITNGADASFFTSFGLHNGGLGQARINFIFFNETVCEGLNGDQWRQCSDNYDNAGKNNGLQQFSFLCASYSPGNKLVSGLVHPKGYAVNDNFNTLVQFDVSKPNDGFWSINFLKEFEKVPTIILYPIWFPSPRLPKELPRAVKDVSIILENCSTKNCNITTGPSERLGFSFLAIDGNLTNATGIVHGTVDVKQKITKSFPDYTQNFAMTVDSDGRNVFGGVRIDFKNAFASIPSVIATMIDPNDGLVDDLIGDFLRGLNWPVIVVEHITRQSAFFKIGWKFKQDGGDSSSTPYVPASFSFVAVGPVDGMRK